MAFLANSGRVSLWDARTGQPRWVARMPYNCDGGTVKFSDDGSQVIVGMNRSEDRVEPVVSVFDAATGEGIRHWRADRAGVIHDVDTSGRLIVAAIAADGQRHPGQTVYVYDIVDERVVCPLGKGRGDIAFTRDCRSIFVLPWAPGDAGWVAGWYDPFSGTLIEPLNMSDDGLIDPKDHERIRQEGNADPSTCSS
jgi:hypothetical protein